MEGKNMLEVVKSIKDKKTQKEKALVEKENQKLKERESFYRCKENVYAKNRNVRLLV